MTTFSNPEGVAAPIGQYSHVARIDLGDVALLFISGQVALGPDGMLVGTGDAATQAARIFENLKTIMEANGGALADIVKLTTFVTNMDDRASLSEVRRRYFGDAAPASTLVEITRLASDDMLVEIEAVGVVPNA
ncbi:MAG TPA: RidA family protein [Thermomicrobiales bacterium]|nr:RidA family protein [Thermomicrobiales bacterium]